MEETNMILNEAIELKNKYSSWISDALRKLNDDSVIYETTEEHRRGDVYPDETNYTVTLDTDSRYRPNTLLCLLERLYDEGCQLEDKILEECAAQDGDLEYDADLYLHYTDAFRVLRQLTELGERVEYVTQRGYKINSDGKQVPYECHIRKTYTPVFDPIVIFQMYDEIVKKYIEKRYVTREIHKREIDFESEFTTCDSFDEVYRIFDDRIFEKYKTLSA